MTIALNRPAKICIGCWQHLRLPVPLRGVASLPFRLFGVRPSRMNPNTCTICEVMFGRIMKARKLTIDATILFADLRGYTSLSQSTTPEAMAALLDTFYDEASTAIWNYDGLLNKAMGDSVMAVFNFPIMRDDHAKRAVAAARAIQQGWAVARAKLVGESVGIGIGIDSGMLSFGEFGSSNQDFTAIGTVVNTASRAQSVAAADEILVTEAVHDRVGEDLAGSRAQEYRLKGYEAPTLLYAA